VLLIALLVDVVPGGGTAASVVGQAVLLAFLASLGWFAMIMYRQNRTSIYGLGDTRRAIVYVAVGVAVVTLTATSRLWRSPAGEVAWLVLLGGAIYAVVAVVVAARRYE
jgi:TRAP-type C4-dicarboxylate transport system permease small subunit